MSQECSPIIIRHQYGNKGEGPAKKLIESQPGVNYVWCSKNRAPLAFRPSCGTEAQSSCLFVMFFNFNFDFLSLIIKFYFIFCLIIKFYFLFCLGLL